MKLHHDEEWLRRMYWDEGLSTRQIGKLAGVDGKTVQAQMVKFGIPRRNDKLGGFDTYKDREWLYRKYVVEQFSTLEIGAAVGRNNTSICNWLRKFGIPIRDPNELRLVEMSEEEITEAVKLYEEGWSLLKLMDRYSVSQGVLQRRMKGLVEYRPQNRRYCINEHVFDNLDNEQAAYFAGFLFADGGIRGTTLSVVLSYKDKIQVERIKEFLSCENPIDTPSQNGYRKARLHCSGIHLTARLSELGVSNNVVGLEVLRGELTTDSSCHWLRGFHDGDGSAVKAGCLTFCGKRDVLEFVRDLLDPVVDEKGTRTIHKHKHADAFYLTYSKGYPARLASEFMYSEATIFLERKWRVITDIWPEKSPGSVPECVKRQKRVT